MKIIVIGCGLIGSAAARHLAHAGHKVIAIGPGEPDDKRNHRGVFASHYDEGRITRCNATDPFWAQVSKASIARYRGIERASGVTFFSEVGAMMAGPQDGGFMRAACDVSDRLGTHSLRLDSAAVTAAFPFLTFPAETLALFEPKSAGHISPRRLVSAQLTAARAAGAQIINKEVAAIDGRDGDVIVHFSTEHEPPLRADRALIATGAMTDHIAPQPLHQRVNARTVALFEVSEVEAKRLHSMPAVVFREPGSDAEPYLLPPIRYPDGRLYIKLGGDPVDRHLNSPEEIGDWFRSGGNPAVRDHLEAQIRRLMPNLQIERTIMDACVTTFTPSGRPVIDWLDSGIAVASGGNGAGAKCSEELGRLAAELITDREDPLLLLTAHEGGTP